MTRVEICEMGGSLPLLAYRLPEGRPVLSASDFEAVFESHGWPPAWRNGVYSFHHFHSTAHEVLGVYAGNAEIQFGGESGSRIDVHAGDAVLIPAGLSHCLIKQDGAFRVVGAYPKGQVPDLLRGTVDLFPDAEARLRAVPVPPADPLLGLSGGTVSAWTTFRET